MMLDKTDVGIDSDLDVPAISIQFSSAIGQTRNLVLTTGVKLDCTKDQLNNVLDKIRAAVDRQKILHDLEQTRMLLKNEEQSLHLHRQQFTTQITKFNQDWTASGRRGDYKPQGGQAKILEGLEQNEKNSIARIVELRKNIEEMEGRCR